MIPHRIIAENTFLIFLLIYLPWCFHTMSLFCKLFHVSAECIWSGGALNRLTDGAPRDHRFSLLSALLPAGFELFTFHSVCVILKLFCLCFIQTCISDWHSKKKNFFPKWAVDRVETVRKGAETWFYRRGVLNFFTCKLAGVSPQLSPTQDDPQVRSELLLRWVRPSAGRPCPLRTGAVCLCSASSSSSTRSVWVRIKQSYRRR